jgi:hypothetical protein
MTVQLDRGRQARATADPPWLSDIEGGRDLGRAELRKLAAEIAQRSSTWRFLVRHDPKERTYVQLHRDAHLDVWLLCWANDQETGLHDHDLSSGAVHVCEGELVEDRVELREGALQRVSVTRAAGATFDFDSSHVHCLRHSEGAASAVSIHVYSPALWRMGYYDVDENGLLRRVSVSYAEEMSVV